MKNVFQMKTVEKIIDLRDVVTAAFQRIWEGRVSKVSVKREYLPLMHCKITHNAIGGGVKGVPLDRISNRTGYRLGKDQRYPCPWTGP